MKLFRITVLGLASIALALGLTLSSAQALPPVGKVVKVKPETKKATGEEKLSHGMKLVITMNDKSTVRGTVVWADEDADYLLLRVKPGTAPRKILGKNIADVTRIRLTSDSGTVLPDEPEIHAVTMDNGARTVKYFAPTLSPAEKAKLADLETAQNETAQTEYVMSLAMQTMREEARTAREKTIAQAKNNEFMNVDLYWFAAGPYYYARYYGYGYPAYGVSTTYSNSSPTLTETVLTKDLPLVGKLAKQRRDLAQMQNQVLFDDRGQLVAVLTEAQK
jgi:hypothetical protein